jgi:hypothetical protein
MCGRPGAPVQLMRLTLFLVVDSAAGMSAVMTLPELGAKRNLRGLSGMCGCGLVTPRLSVATDATAPAAWRSTVIGRASSRVSRFGRRVVRRSDMSEIGGEAEVRGLRLKTTLMTYLRH